MSDFDITHAHEQQIVFDQLSIYNWNKDVNNIFTLVQYKRRDGSLYKDIVLSGGTSPLYTTRTERLIDLDGVTVLELAVYAIIYIDGLIISEILQ